MTRRGRFITFEGGEGAGKSTQTRALAHRLRECGLEVVLTREPGGTPGAEAVRTVLLSGGARRYGAAGEAILFAVARADHVDRVIRPALARGDWVISDRFMDSTRAYQATGGASPALVAELERLAVDGVVPDLTIVLDVAPDLGLARAARRAEAGGADRYEGDPLALHRRRRDAFLAIAAADPGRCVVVSAHAPSPEVADTVWRETTVRLDPVSAAACRAGAGAG